MPEEVQGTAVAVVEDGRQSTSFLAAILQAARDPSVDATKVSTMAELAVKLQDRERETEFNRALNAAILEMPVITREGVIRIAPKDGNPGRIQGRFARFEDIYRVVRPVLERFHLALRFNVGETAQGITVQPILSHANGYTERGDTMKLPPDGSGSKNNTQAVGSAVAYGKRYAMCAMLNIVTEADDTDGNVDTVVHLPMESEQSLLVEAEAAHEAGRYSEWFAAAGPKARAFLISGGHHVRFGGQTALPSGHRTPVQPEPEPEPEPVRQPPAASGPKSSAADKAAQWTDWFVDEVKLCRSAGSVEALQVEHADTLAKLERFPDLHHRADRAVADQLASL